MIDLSLSLAAIDPLPSNTDHMMNPPQPQSPKWKIRRASDRITYYREEEDNNNNTENDKEKECEDTTTITQPDPDPTPVPSGDDGSDNDKKSSSSSSDDTDEKEKEDEEDKKKFSLVARRLLAIEEKLHISLLMLLFSWIIYLFGSLLLIVNTTPKK
jgi:hypothetical protein